MSIFALSAMARTLTGPEYNLCLAIEDNKGSGNPRLGLLPKICKDNYEEEYHI